MGAVDDGLLPVKAVHRRADDSDDQVITSVFTSAFTTKDHGESVLTQQLVTTKVTASSSSSAASSSASSSSSSNKSSSSSSSSSSGKSSSSSSASSSSSSASSTITSASATSTSSGASAKALSSSGSAAGSLAAFPSVTASATASSDASKATSSNTSSIANGSSSSRPLSTGAIIGIAAGGGALLILILIYIIRKRCLHRRERRLNDWAARDTGFDFNGGPFEKIGPADAFVPERTPSIRKEPAPVPTPTPPPQVPYAAAPPRRQYIPTAPVAPGQMLPPRGIAPGQVIPPAGAPRAPARAYTPPMGYNDPPMGMFQNTAPVARYNTPPPGGGYNNYPVAAMAPQRADSPATIPRALTPSHGSANSVSFALVRNAFLPSLPDELAVSQGEMVRVLSEYDDGWALCANMRGDQGAVPLECLQRQRVNVPNAGAGGVPTRSRDDQLAFVPAG